MKKRGYGNFLNDLYYKKSISMDDIKAIKKL